ncbi:MAG: FAD:protein FMN transferase, partial [Candidatus Latescibacterota bacterium]
MRFLSVVLLMLLVGVVPALAEGPLFEVSVNKYLMGTRVETTTRHTDIVAFKNALLLAYQEMARVELVMSAHNANSEVSKINQAAGVHPVVVSD